MPQWYTAVSVARPIVLTLIHFQYCTSSVIVWAFIFDFISMLKIWSVFPAATAGLKSRTKLETGSAVVVHTYYRVQKVNTVICAM